MNWLFLIILNRVYQIPLLLSVYKGFKYILHVTTKTSEIYRLCNNVAIENEKEMSVSHEILYRIDRSIFYSTKLIEEKNQLKQTNCEIDQVVNSISVKKEFPKENNSMATQILTNSLIRIYETNQVLFKVEENISTKYDCDNELHEEKLMKLWNEMKPNTPLESRISKQWIEIGFQGSDPSTDFRGMGIQGLFDLLYFVQKYPSHAESILQHSSHPIYWYPYAIVGINLTKFAYQILESRKLQLFLFQYGATFNIFQEFYCCLFYKFNQFWILHQPPLTVMDFELKFNEFKNQVENDLLIQTITLLE